MELKFLLNLELCIIVDVTQISVFLETAIERESGGQLNSSKSRNWRRESLGGFLLDSKKILALIKLTLRGGAWVSKSGYFKS